MGSTPLDVFVWTGTLPEGTRSGSACTSCGVATGVATLGTSSAVDAKWVNNLLAGPCATTDAHIYCFEK